MHDPLSFTLNTTHMMHVRNIVNGLMRAALLVLLAVALSTPQLHAQEERLQELTLQECVDLALENNIDIIRAQNGRLTNEVAIKEAFFNFFPSLSASVNLNRNFGTTFDQVTFSRIQANTTSSNPSISMNLTLFDGLDMFYRYDQAQINAAATQKGIERTRNNVLVQVVNAYLNVVLQQSSNEITQQRINLLNRQLEQSQRQFDAGTAVEADVLNVQSQIAVEELNLVRGQNTLRNNKLTLLQLLQVEPTGGLEGGYEFVAIDTSAFALNVGEQLPSVTEVQDIALNTMPNLDEQRLNMESSALGIKRARAGYYPTLTLSAGASSSYSTNARFFSPEDSTFFQPTLFEQYEENVSYGIGLRLNIPIFSQWQNKGAVQRAQITYDNARLDYDNTRYNLINDVRQSYQSLEAARIRVRSSDVQVASAKQAFENSEARYNEGLVDFYTYIESLNNLSRLQLEQVQSRYEYFFNRQIIGVYLGEEVNLQN